jgi:competence protein ComEA
MTPGKLNRLWLLATGILIIIILISSIIIWLGRDRGKELVLSSKYTDPINPKTVIVYGAVTNPGSYSLNPDDTIKDLLNAAGGVNKDADISNIKIIIPQIVYTATPQKVDINRAEVWLLQALPGIGEVRAQAIIDYRSQNGLFKNIEDITQIPGLNQSTFEKIKELITISE